MTQTVETVLAEGLKALSLSLPGQQLTEGMTQLLRLHALLMKWAGSINLTSIRDPQAIVSRHFLDSLAVLPYLDAADERCLDMGTGAGFPGLPLAIFLPHKTFVLLDGNNKKIAFVRQAIMQLGLSNVEAVARHSSNYQPAYRFDAVLCRAVGSLELLQQAVRHLLKKDGRLLCMKAQMEENAIECLPSYRFDRMISLAVPGLQESRCLVKFLHSSGL